jgi:hypothetical protein
MRRLLIPLAVGTLIATGITYTEAPGVWMDRALDAAGVPESVVHATIEFVERARVELLAHQEWLAGITVIVSLAFMLELVRGRGKVRCLRCHFRAKRKEFKEGRCPNCFSTEEP